jgi:hypothetical protein
MDDATVADEPSLEPAKQNHLLALLKVLTPLDDGFPVITDLAPDPIAL